jgi:hypothetical protein
MRSADSLPLPIINHTRYVTEDLQALLQIATRNAWYETVVFKHYTPGKGATVSGYEDPLLVKMERLAETGRYDSIEIGIVKPTRTGACFPGMEELALLACMHGRYAPVPLRRQLLIRVGTDHYAGDRNIQRYFYNHDHWQPDPPRLRFLLRDRTREDLVWQKRKAEALHLLNDAYTSVKNNRGNALSHRRRAESALKDMRASQAETEKALARQAKAQAELAQINFLGFIDR